LSITNGSNYSANGTVNVNGGTLLVNQPSGLPQDTIAGHVVVAPGHHRVSLGVAPAWQSSDVGTLLTNANFQPGSFLGLDVAPATTVTYAPAITAPIGIVKSNTGTLILSATNSTYTGPTIVSGGVLSSRYWPTAGCPAASASLECAANLVFSNGSTIQYTAHGVDDRSFSFAGGATFDVTQAATVLTSPVGPGFRRTC